MAVQLVTLDGWLDRVVQAPDEFEQLRLLHTLGSDPKVRVRSGRKEHWLATGGIDVVRERSAAAVDHGRRLAHEVSEAAAKRLAWEHRPVHPREARERAGTPASSSSTTCSCSRATCSATPSTGGPCVSACASGTRACCSTSSRTPIRSSSRSRRSSRRPTPKPASKPWDEIAVDPGRLFFVGDPKQSIYRFRRADIARVPRAPATRSARRRTTSRATSARSAPVIEWVNATFGDLIAAAPGSQPEYVPLTAVRDAPPGGPRGRAARHRRPRRRRARRRAARARGRRRRGRDPRRDAASGWPVAHAEADGTQVWRAVPPGRHLRPAARRAPRSATLEDALEPRRASRTGRRRRRSSTAPARSATCSLTLQAVDDPTDQLALVSALRSPVFGCGDDDLYTFRSATAAAGTTSRRSPSRSPTTTRSPRRCVRSRPGTTTRSVAGAERAARPHRPRAPRARGRLRPRSAPRPVAAGAVRRRPGSRVRRRREGGSSARLPRTGPSSRRPRARGSSRRCCPRPTTTPCAS